MSSVDIESIRKFEKKIIREVSGKNRRYLYDNIDFSSQLIGVVGARGVGKTTLLLQYTKEIKSQRGAKKALYFSYDFSMYTDTKLFVLAEEFTKSGGEVLIVDEIHKYADFAKDLKAIFDFFPKLKVIFTGSCATSIYNAQADLSRRVVLYQMAGLSYREFLEFKLKTKLPSYTLEEILANSIDIIDKLSESFTALEYFEEYLTYGYYPFYFKEKNNYLRLLSAVINQTIDVDLVNLGLIKSNFTNKLKKLMVVISESVPYQLNITKIATQIEVSRNSVYSYLNQLDKGGLLNVVNGEGKGLGKLTKPEKLFFNNTNLFYCFGQEPDIGTIRETFFVSQLKQSEKVECSAKGDFVVNGKQIFEIGGEGKSFNQIKDIDNSYLIIDTDSTENEKKIPLWLFGFLY